MTTARGSAPPADETAALRDLLGRVRRALACDDLAEVGRLLPLLAGLSAASRPPPGDDPAARRRALTGLLDEAGRLTEQLRRERAQLAAQLREAGVHRRAGVAYRRASRL